MTKSARRSSSVLLSLLVLIWACEEDTPTDIRSPSVGEESLSQSFEGEGLALPMPIESIFGDEPMMAVARQLPSTFGGFWYDHEGRIVVGLTDPAVLAEAIDLIRPWLGATEPKGFVAQEVEYPFLLLAAYRTLMRNRAFEIPDVVSLGVRESQNRLSVGVARESARPAIVQLLDGLNIPQEAAVFPVEGRSIDSALDLEDAQPDTEVQGGWMYAVDHSSGELACTIGFGALDPSESYAERFVVNSHCTSIRAQNDGDTIAQPTMSGTVFGLEILDPPGWLCGTDECRHADAALIDAHVDLAFGTIARTVDSTGCDQCSASIEVDTSDPTIEITGRLDHTFENEELHKIGRKTGWTYGVVEDTCVDVTTTFKKLCSDRVDYSSDGGDSGAPVFALKPDGTAELRGIHWGRVTLPLGFNDAWMSDLHQIEKDLGDLYVYEHPATAEISGPSVVPASATCQWYGEYDGRPPLSFEWRKNGAVVSTTGEYTTSNAGTSDFTLSFKVTDGKSDTDIQYLNVTVDPNAPPGCF